MKKQYTTPVLREYRPLPKSLKDVCRRAIRYERKLLSATSPRQRRHALHALRKAEARVKKLLQELVR